MLEVTNAIRIPLDEFEWSFARSGGPGGQNVNKVASKVELRVDLARVEGLGPHARARLQALAGPRLDADGRLIVRSQRTRDQHRNLEDARDKVRRLLMKALHPPRTRRATAPSASAREERLREKKSRAARKRTRAASKPEED
jgi:ribosome-associated protein